MGLDAFDPEIVQDFLTESGELLDSLEGDLVTLEETPADLDLLNTIFRALHTIKGSASFLGLTNLVSIAHAAESALNAARNGTLRVGRAEMDLLLAAVDTVKVQMGQIASGEPLAEPDAAVVAALSALGAGRSAVSTPSAAPVAVADHPVGDRPLALPENKADLIEYLLADLDETLDQIDLQIAGLRDQATRAQAGGAMAELGQALARAAEFFEYDQMAALATLLLETGRSAAELRAEVSDGLMPRVETVATILREQAEGLASGVVIDRGIDAVAAQIRALLSGEPLPVDAGGPGDAPNDEPLVNLEAPGAGPAAADTAAAAAKAPEHDNGGSAAEQTIRVEVGRLETLMNLVGELVLQKNRVAALSRRIEAGGAVDQDLSESFALAAGNLDRVTGDIQVAVMRTRMQPLDKLFGKYPRLIRDLSKKTGKKLRLVIEGGETEVDKSVIERLGDPMVHLLRNAADHGLELPEQRAASGKDETGTIRIVASHAGSHVSVRIIDDGRGMAREKIAAKAVAQGLVSEQEAAQLSDREVLRFILAAGFSTAETVTDLSGRGVGMDVVRNNVEALKGTIDVLSTPGTGTEIRIAIPLTVAIMPAMMVRVDDEIYAIPLSNLLEIVRPEAERVSRIQGHPVMRLRDTILPLLNAQDLFGIDAARRGPVPFAVVIQHNDRSFGLLVSQLIGQQEIVIKPLDEMFDRKGPASGATVRDDGGVSLIVDVAQLARIAESRRG
jgi:two-component system chemotaxis sensor kinase CheA